MINYTDRLTLLMRDIVSRVPALSFIDMDAVLLFARFGRLRTDGAFATCHSLRLPASEPGYYFWRDRISGQITRRSDWFVTKSPIVSINGQRMNYLISFALPRFCDQSLDCSRKERFYRRSSDAWVAKLDTVVHELYHIDPEQNGIRRVERSDGTYAAHCHGPAFFERVADMVTAYLDTRPEPSAYDFLQHDFATLTAAHAGVTATSFRSFPSYPQRYIERLPEQPPSDASLAAIDVDPWKTRRVRAHYTEADLHVRQFMLDTSRRWPTLRAERAA